MNSAKNQNNLHVNITIVVQKYKDYESEFTSVVDSISISKFLSGHFFLSPHISCSLFQTSSRQSKVGLDKGKQSADDKFS